MKILYVEDNRLDADLTRRELKKSAPDLLMDIVATQRDALLALEKKRDYDLVLSDMRLPDGDGLAILTHIRGRGLPLAVVIITGQGDEDTAVVALKTGAQDYIIKRDGYQEHLPLTLEKALESYRETSARHSQPLRVLYAEHSTSDADLTKRHLAKFAPHIQLEVINSASGVFQHLSDYPAETYQAVLLDYRLSKMNALEILKELRQVYRTDLPIILITGQGDEEVAVQALKLGATDYVVKNQGYLYKIPSVLENAFHNVKLARDHGIVSRLKHQNELILNSASEGIVGLDLAGNHTFLNPAAARMLGYEISEMVGLNGPSLWHHTKSDHTKYHEETCTIHAACREGTVIDNQEDLFWRKDGTSFPVEFSLTPIREENRLLGSVLTFRDITERKQTEREIRESEKRFRAIFERSNIGKCLTLPDGGLLRVNEAFANMLGYRIEEIQETNFLQITHPDDVAESRECVRCLLTGEQNDYRMEKRYIHKNGSVVWTDLSTTLISDEKGKPLYFITSILDITERKQTEEKLREAYEIISGSPVVAFLWKNAKGWPVEFVTDNVEVLFGYTAEELVSGKVSYSGTVHPDDIKRVTKEVADNSKGQGRLAFDHEPYRIITRDGEIKWVNDSTFIRRNAKGEITHYQGILHDITDRILSEEKLQHTLDSLSRAVNTTIQVMVSAVEIRDPYTAGHQNRVANIASAIANELGLSRDAIEGIRMAGTIHDIGKLSIPAEILSKPNMLSDIEFSLIKEHPLRGYEMLKDVESPWPLAEIVYQHHERMDGSGYPRNLKGDEIIMEARIMAVADVVEAMASQRPYRPALGIDVALKEIENNRGILYDADVADACLRLFREKGFQLKNN